MSDIDSLPGRDDTVATPHGVIVSPSIPGNLSTEGGLYPGDSSPESPYSDIPFKSTIACWDEVPLYP
ncbi:hypothetical protein JCM33374_g5244 [Metschnikowia sp. JCM 33374]|nr:hypothetical protein JCM33374_g5244 [Metschnikowia sp. JCM 33374]